MPPAGGPIGAGATSGVDIFVCSSVVIFQFQANGGAGVFQREAEPITGEVLDYDEVIAKLQSGAYKAQGTQGAPND